MTPSDTRTGSDGAGAGLDDLHRRIDGTLNRNHPGAQWRRRVEWRDGDRQAAACRRSIAKRRQSVGASEPNSDTDLNRMTEWLAKLRAAAIERMRANE
ncbi:hypothetical protein [Fodinicurvata sp. EGI_FJ10296]|uniref:hypothetical protein n=1 Tax=Fodinicurvata sp. EGI_FJ10296 TaxID=3231908 RepID=UPI00345547EB